MGTRDVVVVGASAGGVEALRELISGLPADFPAAVLVVLHLPSGTRSALPNILQRAGRLPAKQAEEGDPLRPGHVLVAGPDQHLIVHDGGVTLSRSPTENGHRPAIDVLFRSAAQIQGPRVVGVVLSGALDDGTSGLAAIRSRGGIGVVQDPQEALHPSMPRSAIEGAAPEYVVSVTEMPGLLLQLTAEEVDETNVAPPPPLMKVETALSNMDPAVYESLDRPGEPSTFSCPDCDGTLALIHDEGLLRFRCRVGHAWSAESLLNEQTKAVEGALWVALRSLEERATLTRDMSQRATARGHRHTAKLFDLQSFEAQKSARLVRELLTVMAARLADLEQRTHSEHA